MCIHILILTTTLWSSYYHQAHFADLVRDHNERESGHFSLPAYRLSTWPGLGEEVRLWWKTVFPDKRENVQKTWWVKQIARKPLRLILNDICMYEFFFFNLPVTGTIWWLEISLCPGPAEMHKDEVSGMIRRKKMSACLSWPSSRSTQGWVRAKYSAFDINEKENCADVWTW